MGRDRVRARGVVWLFACLMAASAFFRSADAFADAVTVDQSSLSFPSTAVGSQSAAQTLTYTNGGTTSVTITSIVIASTTSDAGAGDAGAAEFIFITPPSGSITLAATQSLAVQVAFTPTAAGAQSGTVTATVTGQSDVVTTLTGTGIPPTLVATPNPVIVGNVAYSAGQTVTAGVTITNSSTTTTIHVMSLAIGGANASYFTEQPAAPLPVGLGPGASTTVTIGYSPPAGGAYPATLIITSDDPVTPTADVPLIGEVGDPTLSPNASEIIFAPTAVGATAIAQTVVVTNTGFSALVVDSITDLSNVTLSGASLDAGATDASVATDYTVTAPTFPLTLTPSASFSVTVSFTPLVGGARDGAFSFASNDPAGVRTVRIDGTALGSGDTVDPPSLDFMVQFETSQSQTVTFSSVEAYAVHVTSLTWMGDAGVTDFSVVSPPTLPAVINPDAGAPLSLTIQFHPTMEQVNETATLVVGLDDPIESSLSLPMTGYGTVPIGGGDSGVEGDGALGDDGGGDAAEEGFDGLLRSGGDDCTCAEVGGGDARALFAPLGAVAALAGFAVRRRRRFTRSGRL